MTKPLLIALSLLLVASTRAADRPNVLFIAIDDLNDWVGCLGGHPQVKTPGIDRLAARGTVFTNAHCQAPLCNPSRTSVLTGLRPSTTGIYGLRPWIRDVPGLRKVVTLPQHFARHGYRTLATGKIYQGHYGLRENDREFDVVGTKYEDGPYPNPRLAKLPGNPSKKNDWGPVPHRDEERGDYKIASWAIERLGELAKTRGEPFFLSVGIRLPHVPLFAPERWFDLYPIDSVKLPPVLRDDRDDTPRFSWFLHWKLPEHRLRLVEKAKEWRKLVRAYLACVSYLDAQIGRVLDALEREGLADETIVVLWSDHGWHLGEKLITGKNTLWERSTRVPLVLAGPGVSNGGRCVEPVELLDIYPTLIELAGLSTRENLEGLSLVPQLRDARSKRSRPAITTANPGNHSIRTKDWRYIRYADGSEELYDLREDPNEWRNLAKLEVHVQVLSEHRRWLPKRDAPFAPGSAHRTVELKNGKVFWEGREIPVDSPIPGIDTP